LDVNSAATKWRELHAAWLRAEQAARLAERNVTYLFSECANGNGIGPTEAQLEQSESLRKEADRCRNIETAFLQAVFGEP
jgi:hypothetical protein